jgi:hypothetical protein
MKRYRHYGALALAESYYEKAELIWRWNTDKRYFVFEYKQALYSFAIDPAEYEKTLNKLLEMQPEDTRKQEENAFLHCATIKPVATFAMDFLYFQQPENGEDGQYFFRFRFSNNAPMQQFPFVGKVFGGGSDFKKAVMQKTPSALFTGTTKDLDFLYQQWMGSIPRIVRTLDFIGYDDDTKAYVYHDYAVQAGKVIHVNADEFFQLKTTGIKTTVTIKQQLNTHQPKPWLHDYHTAFGDKGLIALAWWFGSLFAQQLRHRYQSYPFFEIIGEAGSGKTDMVDFLFKLIGKENDNFNPNISTMPGFIRKLSESSNLPVVFNETDNEQIAADRHQRKFDWEIAKDWYNGQIGRYTGRKSNDNTTRVAYFKTALLAVQNVPVVASEAITSRFMGFKFDRSHHSDAGKLASERLQMLDITDVSGFTLYALQHEQKILDSFDAFYRAHFAKLANSSIKMQRIKHNHAQLSALVDCFNLILPLSANTITALHTQIKALAEARQDTLNDDHPTIQQFWSNFDYLDSLSLENSSGHVLSENRMNHLGADKNQIAVNLEHYIQMCSEAKLKPLEPLELRRLFPTSRARPFVENKKLRSKLLDRPLNCYIFNRSK